MIQFTGAFHTAYRTAPGGKTFAAQPRNRELKIEPVIFNSQ
jgi:hypothetical protein